MVFQYILENPLTKSADNIKRSKTNRNDWLYQDLLEKVYEKILAKGTELTGIKKNFSFGLSI